MLDQSSPKPQADAQTDSDHFDLVVIGAGITGLNALFAATEYLSPKARVMLVDQKDAPGGMWNTAYDYVRLHQPHPMFTVGDLKWNWNKPRDYLAARDEVRAHLASALDPVRAAVDLHTRFGHTAAKVEEIATPNGHMARITCHPNTTPGDSATLTATRVIHASGLNYAVAQPLRLGSDQVISIIPQDLRRTLAAHPQAAVIVAGGGKTGMDTVLAALADNPARKITLISGRGTNFMNRTRFLPTGLGRWTTGQLASRVFRDMAVRFDGHNEDTLMDHFRQTYATDPGAPNALFLYGLQSEDEQTSIAQGLTANLRDYLTDVTDTDAGPALILRSGAQTPFPAGTIVVNCTGSFFRAPDLPAREPILSPHATILRINARDSFHFLPSVSAFFATHLWFRDQLRDRGFYTLDNEALFRANRNAWVGATSALSYLNQVIVVQTLPLSLLDRCGLDLDKWYPMPRRMWGLMQLKRGATRDIAHCTATLDRVAQRFDLHAGPLT